MTSTYKLGWDLELRRLTRLATELDAKKLGDTDCYEFKQGTLIDHRVTVVRAFEVTSEEAVLLPFDLIPENCSNFKVLVTSTLLVVPQPDLSVHVSPIMLAELVSTDGYLFAVKPIAETYAEVEQLPAIYFK